MVGLATFSQVLQKLLSRVAVFILIAFVCGYAFRPYNNNNGYIVLPVGNSHYRIEYYSAYAKYVKKNRDEAARTLCGGDYSAIYKTRDEISYERDVVPSGCIDPGVSICAE